MDVYVCPVCREPVEPCRPFSSNREEQLYLPADGIRLRKKQSSSRFDDGPPQRMVPAYECRACQTVYPETAVSKEQRNLIDRKSAAAGDSA